LTGVPTAVMVFVGTVAGIEGFSAVTGDEMSYCTSFHRVVSALETEECAFPVVDAHLHGVDFLQETEGLCSLLERMDGAGITECVVFGLPVVKKWAACEPDRPRYYLDDNARCYTFVSTDELLAEEYSALRPDERARFTPLLCGFNPTDRNAVFQVERKLASRDIWRGIGEIMCRHDDLTNLTMEETSRMDHPALFPVYDLAGSRDLPVLVHQNSSSVGHHDRFEYLHEVRNALEGFPGTTFVWAHCGISRRVGHKLYHMMVEDMLGEFPNLFVDLSWVVYDQTVCSGRVPKKRWLDLVAKYPDRFMLGSDLCGHFQHLGKTMARYNTLLELLGGDERDLVASQNAMRVWRMR